MTDFKIGDRVTPTNVRYGSHAGKNLVVLAKASETWYGVGLVGNDPLRSHDAEHGWLSYPAKGLKLAEPAFEVGDKVTVTAKGLVHDGDAGNVTQVDCDTWPFRVRFDDDFEGIYSASELKLVKPVLTNQEKLLAEAGLKLGDRAVAVKGHCKGKVVTVVENGIGSDRYIRGEHADSGGYAPLFLPDELKKLEFKVGDWVKIQGYSSAPNCSWEGRVGKITHLFPLSYLDKPYASLYEFEDGGLTGGAFELGHLVPAEGPAPKFAAKTEDAVNSPSHYTQYPVEVIELTRHMNFGRGNAVKYIARAGHKAEATELEDLKKARWYLDDEISELEKKAAK